MRVVAGDLRGRKIEGPQGDNTRPTTDKVREAVFNALNSLDVVDNCRVVDLFAGSGALGIEALSRGAKHCVFVENDRRAIAVLKENLDALGIADKSLVVVLDVSSQSSRSRLVELLADADLVLADPPYGYTKWPELFASITEASSHATNGAGSHHVAPKDVLVVAETENRATLHENPPEGWKLTRERTYGRTRVGFFRRTGITSVERDVP